MEISELEVRGLSREILRPVLDRDRDPAALSALILEFASRTEPPFINDIVESGGLRGLLRCRKGHDWKFVGCEYYQDSSSTHRYKCKRCGAIGDHLR